MVSLLLSHFSLTPKSEHHIKRTECLDRERERITLTCIDVFNRFSIIIVIFIQGDDGAGLCHTDTVTGRLVLVGMPSYGVACGTRQPRVACRISSYIPWIQQVTNENYCVI